MSFPGYISENGNLLPFRGTKLGRETCKKKKNKKKKKKKKKK